MLVVLKVRKMAENLDVMTVEPKAKMMAALMVLSLAENWV